MGRLNVQRSTDLYYLYWSSEMTLYRYNSIAEIHANTHYTTKSMVHLHLSHQGREGGHLESSSKLR